MENSPTSPKRRLKMLPLLFVLLMLAALAWRCPQAEAGDQGNDRPRIVAEPG